MDLQTLALSSGVVSFGIALLAVLIAFFRRQRSSTIYAGAYLLEMAGLLLFIFPGRGNRLLTLTAANFLASLPSLFLAWGLRHRTAAERAWPRRYWLYGIGFLLLLIAGRNFFVLRVTAISTFAILACVEIILILNRRPGKGRPIPAFLGIMAWIFCTGYILGCLGRIALAVWASSGPDLAANPLYTTYSFYLVTLFLVLFAGLVLTVDAGCLVQELQDKNTELRALALTDELTGLQNRHVMDATIRGELERAARYGEPLSLILADLDHFKDVNDRHGHQAGDAAIRGVALALQGVARKSDRLFRWGGEEFLALIHNADAAGAALVAEKMRRAVAEIPLGKAGSITASFGVAQWDGKESPASWFARVDAALYRAKNLGRNRVETPSPEDEQRTPIMQVQWRAEWDSGNAVLDAEHRRLLELVNDIVDFSLSRPDHDLYQERLQALIREAAAHFQREEELLQARGYPDEAEHAVRHRELEKAIEDFCSGQKGDPKDPGRLFRFLVEEVIIGHLVKEDSLFFRWVAGSDGGQTASGRRGRTERPAPEGAPPERLPERPSS